MTEIFWFIWCGKYAFLVTKKRGDCLAWPILR